MECPKGSFRCDGSMCFPLRLYCNNVTDCYDGTDESNCSPDKRVYQVSRIVIDEKNSNSSSLLIEWEVPPPPPGVKLEFMPAYSIVGRPGNGSQWHNTTWTDQMELRLSNLTAFTLYNLTVYVRIQGNLEAHPPSLYVGAQTTMGPPSAPWNVTVEQLSHTEVLVRWNPPVKPNGLINAYRVFVEPTAPPVMMPVSSSTHQYVVSYKYVPGTNYSFQVVAENRYSASNRSAAARLLFDGSAIIPVVTNLRAQNIDNTSVQLVWSALESSYNISSYVVLIRTSNFYAQVRKIAS